MQNQRLLSVEAFSTFAASVFAAVGSFTCVFQVPLRNESRLTLSERMQSFAAMSLNHHHYQCKFVGRPLL